VRAGPNPLRLQRAATRRTIVPVANNAEEPRMNPVRMYTTQVCPYCLRAKALLKQRGVEAIDEIRVDLDPQARETMQNLTGRRTVPQIFIGERHVGGCDDLIELDRRGDLLPMLRGAAA
jgi:glutaredoxin 3